jgi:hypothetical protein
MDGAVGAFGQRFADGLRGPLRRGAQRDYLSAVLFFQLQRGFQRVRVRLVDFVRDVGFLNPLARWRDAELRIARGTCLIATMIFMRPMGQLNRRPKALTGPAPRLKLLNIRHPLVPPKPKLFESAYSIFMGRAWCGT